MLEETSVYIGVVVVVVVVVVVPDAYGVKVKGSFPEEEHFGFFFFFFFFLVGPILLPVFSFIFK